jgi:hypothetical protein
MALEASNVIDLRLWKIAQGRTETAGESRLMVKEKVDALFEAKRGSSAQVIYMRRRVATNTSRLQAGSVTS